MGTQSPNLQHNQRNWGIQANLAGQRSDPPARVTGYWMENHQVFCEDVTHVVQKVPCFSEDDTRRRRKSL
jgi:hypothetical protein